MSTESGRPRGRWTFQLFGRRWGFERSPIYHGDSLYMGRWILYVAGWTLRLHRIMRPDLYRALHDHPFWFVTLPLGRYVEEYWWFGGFEFAPADLFDFYHIVQRGETRTRTVRRFVPQFRGRMFRHRITALPDGPVWTIVLSGPYRQRWGFYSDPNTFHPYTEYSE